MQSHIEKPEILYPPADTNEPRAVHEQKQEDLERIELEQEGENPRRTAAKLTEMTNNF